jgi:hypothetical protein
MPTCAGRWSAPSISATCSPVSAIWPGPLRNAYLSAEFAKQGLLADQPPLMQARTAATTPFRLDLHQGDVGHTLVVGPTGAGKSVLLNILALQWRRYPGARVVIFDKGAAPGPPPCWSAAPTTIWAAARTWPSSRWPASTIRTSGPGPRTGSRTC